MTIICDKIDLLGALKKYKFSQLFHNTYGNVQFDKDDSP